MPTRKTVIVVFRNGIIRDFESISEFCREFKVNIPYVSKMLAQHKTPEKLTKYYEIEEIKVLDNEK